MFVYTRKRVSLETSVYAKAIVNIETTLGFFHDQSRSHD